MSIEFFGIGGPNQIGSVKKPQKPEAAAKSDNKTGADQVQFSSVLQDVHKAQAAKGSGNTTRADRIKELKAQIAEGSYRPDLEKVASSLLQFMFEEK